MKKIIILSFFATNVLAQSVLIRPNKVESQQNASIDNIILQSSNQPNILGKRHNGTAAAPTNVSADDDLLSLQAAGYGGTSFTGVRATIRLEATQNWTTNNNGTRIKFLNTPNGSTNLTERMVINQNGNVGIGVSLPDYKLEILQETSSDRGVGVYRFGGDAPAFFGISARGNATTPTKTFDGDILSRFGGKGHNETGFTSATGRIDIVANENWSSTATGTDIKFYATWAGNNITEQKMIIRGSGNVGIGFETPESKLSVNGDLQLAVENKNFADGAIFNALGRGGKSIIRFNGNGTAHIKGIAGGVDGQVLHFMTTNTAELKLYFRDGNAAAADRIEFSQDGGWIIDLKLRIRAMGGCTLIYDGIDNFWRVLGNN